MGGGGGGGMDGGGGMGGSGGGGMGGGGMGGGGRAGGGLGGGGGAGRGGGLGSFVPRLSISIGSRAPPFPHSKIFPLFFRLQPVEILGGAAEICSKRGGFLFPFDWFVIAVSPNF